MPTFKIFKRNSRIVLYSGQADTRRAFLKAIPAGTNLTDANFEGDDVSGLSFAGVTLTEASFKGANCAGTKFHGAVLTRADFTNANVEKANFQTATVTNMVTTNVKRRGTKGL